MTLLSDIIFDEFAAKLGPDQIASPKALHLIDLHLKKFIRESQVPVRRYTHHTTQQ